MQRSGHILQIKNVGAQNLSPTLGREVHITGEIFKLLCVRQVSMWAKVLSVVPDEDLQSGSYDDN